MNLIGGIPLAWPGTRQPGRAASTLVPALVALVVALAAFGALILVGPAAPAGAGATSVAIVDYAYGPATLTVVRGTTVTWTNTGRVPHSVTSDDPLGFDSSPACALLASQCLQPGQTFRFTFDTVGTFGYHCKLHPFMHGTVIVQAAPVEQAAPATTQPRTAATTPTSGNIPVIGSTSSTVGAPPGGAVLAAPVPGATTPGTSADQTTAFIPEPGDATAPASSGAATQVPAVVVPAHRDAAGPIEPGRPASSDLPEIVGGLVLLVLGAGGLVLRVIAGRAA